MEGYTGKCLPRYLQIRILMAKNTRLLVIFTVLLMLIGFALLWFGLESSFPSPSPIPAPLGEDTPVASDGAAPLQGERAQVVEVVDGDTFSVGAGEDQEVKVRMIGIDTPETKDPRRPVGCFGKEASNKARQLLEGKTVILQKDISEKDKYARLLRYVYLPLPDGNLLFVNDYLIREGYGSALTYPPDVKFSEQFRQAEREARQAKKGLWGRC